jgi:hypothetical protein
MPIRRAFVCAPPPLALYPKLLPPCPYGPFYALIIKKNIEAMGQLNSPFLSLL